MENVTTAPASSRVEPRGLMIFRLIFEVSIAVAGIIGNILVCLVIRKSFKSKKSMNTFLLSLATADLGVLLLNFPIALSKEQSPTRYVFGRFFCLYIAPATETFFCASIWSITAIAVDRYRNIVGATRVHRRTTLKIARSAIAVTWLLSFAVASLPLYVIMEYEDGSCGPVWPDLEGRNIMMQAYNISLAVVWYVLPLAVISVTYLRIRQRMAQSIRFREAMRREMPGNTQDARRRRQLRDSEKMKKILTPLVILFAITMLPITTLRLVVSYVSIGQERFFIVYNVSVICVITNSAINPILYYIVSKEFRLAYKLIINSFYPACCQPFKVPFGQTRWSLRSTPKSSSAVDTKEGGVLREQHENTCSRARDNERRHYISAV